MAQRIMQMAMPEEEANAAKAFQGADVLTNAEVNVLLAKYEASKRSELGDHWMPHPHVAKTRKYLEKLKVPTNDQALQAIRMQLSQYPLFEYEFALLANLLPETVEEAVTLIPSLQDGRLKEQELDQMLSELQSLELA